MPKKASTPIQKTLQNIFRGIFDFFKNLAQFLIHFLTKLLETVASITKATMSGASILIAALSFLVLVIAALVYLIGSALGIHESEMFQQIRDNYIFNQVQVFRLADIEEFNENQAEKSDLEKYTGPYPDITNSNYQSEYLALETYYRKDRERRLSRD